jgi:hypothetical protein
MITAPWGETFTPPAVRIYGFLAYNPYAVGCGNSGRFFTWQDHRAGEAVEGVAAERGKRLTVRPAPRTQLVNVGAILILASFTFIPVFLNDWWRFRPLPAVLRWIIFMVFLACVLMISSVPAFHSTGPMVAMKMGNLVQAVSWTLPRDTKLAAAILFAIALPLYLAVEKLFRSTELLPTAAAAQARGNYN